MNKSQTRYLMRVLTIVASAGLTACTDPAALGPAPEFVRLSRISSLDGFDGPGDLTPLPLLSCPPILNVPADWTRRPLLDEPATVALPPSMLGASARFGKSPGIVFNDPESGLVAIAYGGDQPLLARSFVAGSRSPITSFSRSCEVSVNGRPGVLILSVSAAQDSSVSALQFDPVMLLRVKSPAGRQLNALVALNAGRAAKAPGAIDARLLVLLSVVASLQW